MSVTSSTPSTDYSLLPPTHEGARGKNCRPRSTSWKARDTAARTAFPPAETRTRTSAPASSPPRPSPPPLATAPRHRHRHAKQHVAAQPAAPAHAASRPRAVLGLFFGQVQCSLAPAPPSASSHPPDFLPSFSAITSPDDSYPSASRSCADTSPSSHVGSGSVEARLRYVAEQANFAGFPDLDTMITAYYAVLAGDPSLLDSEEDPSTRYDHADQRRCIMHAALGTGVLESVWMASDNIPNCLAVISRISYHLERDTCYRFQVTVR
ncbi:hypothetical protein BST61_g5096 [Cercospora zeina]